MCPLRAGDVVVDKYRVERQLGSGGMGIVLQATHLQLNQPVALKFLVDSGLEPAVAAERFLREARATFRLRSEHTVRVMDVGTLPTGEPFIVMEMLVGKDFKQLLAERGPLPAGEAALYMTQVCAALSEAHALGIVHRDLKARNLYLTTRVDGSPCVKVLDFGISKLGQDSELAPLTRPDMGMGSPRYMAPEQWTSASTVDSRADIYAAGAVFYELLTGAIPLAGVPLAEVIKRVRAGAVPSPREIRPDLPEPICRVVMRALRPHPEERFPTAQHFAQAIREAIPSTDTNARPKPVLATTVQTAVVNREVMLARAQIEARFGANAASDDPSSSAPTPQDRPRPPPPPSAEPTTDPEGEDVPSSTLDEGVPAAAPRHSLQQPATAPLPIAPQARPVTADDDPYAEDVATVVTRSPIEGAAAGGTSQARGEEHVDRHATLQVAEAPPEIQALRNKYSAPPVAMAVPLPPPPPPHALPPPPPPPPLARPTSPMAPLPVRPPPRLEPTIDDPRARSVAPRAMSGSLPPNAPAKSGMPAWLFWTFLVLGFCAAGGLAAALLSRFFP
ncbi:MAG TPA: serine/threonine-protein kinase [Polyangiaceae bacterium]|jgi:serine/threonine-protein kinase